MHYFIAIMPNMAKTALLHAVVPVAMKIGTIGFQGSRVTPLTCVVAGAASASQDCAFVA